MNIDKILVVLEHHRQDWSLDDPLIERASELARRSSASVILLTVAYESALSYGAFAARQEVDAGRLRLLADRRERQTELQLAMERTHGLTVSTVSLWGPDECDCVLRTAEARGADLIMKASGNHAYFIGLLSNTDWDLLRGARCAVWFVAEEGNRTPRSGIIAAIDQSFAESDTDEDFRLDHEAFDAARLLSDLYSSPLYAVHAYQLPRMLPGFEGHAPPISATVTPGAVSPGVDDEARSEIARRHGKVVQDFVDEHGIPVDDLILEEGSVDQVLSQAADAKAAGLIVMGSSSKSWWDHLRGRASAEPTLSSAACDVLFVRSADASDDQAAA